MPRPAACLLAALLAAPALAQDQPPPPTPSQPAPQDEVEPAQNGWPAQSWLMPEVEVVGEPTSDLREEQRIGSYAQPRWTAQRRFTTTRIYVLPESAVETEYWLRIDEPRNAGETKITHMYEVGFGLPYRFQFDFYVDSIHEGEWDFFDETERKYELRWAVADWGQLWGNPTLYYEIVDRQRGPDKLEYKLLLGDELAEGWHWGSNLVWEQETGGEQERELEFTGALSQTLVDDRFSLGAEFKTSQITNDVESAHRHEYFLGPSAQYKPVPRMHMDLAPLVGFGPDSDSYQIFFVMGWEF
ncbi:MAG TPA: hypothetical protein VFY71_08975 [Planctomycetota bacterium]|nr:hypothetical protein [Planctomycetota bacterium]